MESQYNVETTKETTASSSGGSTDVGLDKIYMKSIDSILKIAEMVLSLIVFICVTSHPGYSYIGGGWVQFVSISCLITVLILWIFFMLRIVYKLPGPWQLIILIYYIVFFVFYLISFLICAIQAARIYQNGGLIAGAILIYYIVFFVFYLISFLVCAIQSGKYAETEGLVAGAVFCVLILIALGIDTFFQFRKWQDSGSGLGTRTTSSTAATTTTHTTYETRTQY